MNLNPSKYLYNWSSVDDQENVIPFLGDVYQLSEEDFYAVQKSLKVVEVNLDMDGAHVIVEMVRSPQHKIPKKFDYEVVGVTGSVPDENRLKPFVVEWKLQSADEDEIRKFPVEIAVPPGPLDNLEFTIQPIKPMSVICKSQAQDLKVSSDLVKVKDLINVILRTAGDMCTDHDRKSLDDYSRFIFDMCAALEKRVMNFITDVSSENWVKISYILLNQVANLNELTQFIEGELDAMKGRYVDKRHTVDLFEKKGIKFIGSDKELETVIRENEDVCALLFYEKMLLSSRKICSFFFDFIEKSDDPDTVYCAVDMDLVTSTRVFKNRPKNVTIQQFRNGRCVVEDLYRDVNETRRNVVECHGEWKHTNPKKRAVLRMQCPGFFKENCPDDVVTWICKNCSTTMYFSFDDEVHCDRCGTASIRECYFRCSCLEHDTFLPVSDKTIKELSKMRPMDEKNILILGQSGVGKSTWINAIVNYTAFNTLENAEKYDVMAPIPSRFVMTDDNLVPRTIYAGDVDDDDLEIGQSVTQVCNKYSVLYNNMVINFIDTPGLGDSRGVDEDRANVKKILDFVRYVDDIHGICLLLKPNETRISVLLSYCVKEILSNLHQSASNNLIFCFTNARSTFYKPGETMPLLIKLLEEIGVHLQMKERTFCLDNEAFKYLCCKNTRGITFTGKQEESFSMSWDKSVEETHKLLDRVVQLAPHRTLETWSLNRARRIILSMIRPLGDITKNIETNIQQYDLQRHDLETSQKTLKELKQYITVPQLKLTSKELGYPRTVCTSERCVRYQHFQKVKERKTLYVQHCHEHCYLKGVTPEQYPNPMLKDCWAMTNRSKCHQCSCSWENHMHILYDQIVDEVDTKDVNVEKALRDASSDADAKEAILREFEKTKRKHEEEKMAIIRLCVKFAHFLKNNAIAGYNDALGDYLKMLIQKEELKRDRTELENEKIEKMKATSQLYENEVAIFRKAAEEGAQNVTAEDIGNAEEELYDLPIYGDQIREAMEIALRAEDLAFRYQGSSKVQQPVGKKKKGKKPKEEVAEQGLVSKVKGFFFK